MVYLLWGNVKSHVAVCLCTIRLWELVTEHPTTVTNCKSFLTILSPTHNHCVKLETLWNPKTSSVSTHLCSVVRQTGHCDRSAIGFKYLKSWWRFWLISKEDSVSLHDSKLLFSIELYNMYYTREYIIWSPFYLLWRPLKFAGEGVILLVQLCSLFEKPNCQYVVEEKNVFTALKSELFWSVDCQCNCM